MLCAARSSLARAGPARLRLSPCQRRFVATQESESRKEGDISSVFRSLSGGEDEALPQRFADVKRGLAQDKGALHASWNRLLKRLEHETGVIKAKGSAGIPEIDFADLDKPPAAFNEALRKTGVAVVRQVIPEKEARAFKDDIEAYIAANPSTKGECCNTHHRCSCPPRTLN